MPFKSIAQRNKFRELLKQGKISQSTFDEWEAATDKKRLLPRIEKKPKSMKVKYAKILK